MKATILVGLLVGTLAGGCMTDPPPKSAYGAKDDAAVAAAVRERLEEDPATRRSLISVSAFRGHVALRGTVPPGVKAHAIGLARGVPGVRVVEDNLAVSTWSPASLR